jgi:SAM-dependent methyltransferase
VSSKEDQYARQAEGWTERAYADVGAYLAHRAELIESLGSRLDTGETVLDLACGDGGLGEALLARGFGYRGIDATPAMVESARHRLAGRAEVGPGDLNDYVPAERVAATTVFRAIYYVRDRAAFFMHVAGYTEKKLLFDLNPRQYRVDDVVADLRASGFGSVELRPFLVPQTVTLPRPLLGVAKALERSGPLARLALRVRFTYLVAASR